MTLTSLWTEKRDQLEGKHVRQIISFAGDGKLRDDAVTSREFRDFLSHIPSQQIQQYLNECLAEKFDDSGFVLQDLVNQIGKRLGFKVTDGRYRGVHGQLGSDGIWTFPDGHVVIVEVKTTDTYQINLDSLADYRRQVIAQGKATEENSSMLIVLGRDDRNTSSLESQIRGSRYAWNIRILSVDALARLMRLKETVEDPAIIQRISNILIPREFTKLDEIINLVFSTAEDVKEDKLPEIANDNPEPESLSRPAPSSFHEACVRRIEHVIGQPLLKQSKTTYSTAEDTFRVSCAISREYGKGSQIQYWFGFHTYQQSFLECTHSSYVAFGCGTADQLIYIPFAEFVKWLGDMNTTENEDRMYWHVHIAREEKEFTLIRKEGAPRITITQYVLS